jgi:hypothetical protein
MITIGCTPLPLANVKKVTLWLKEEPSDARWVALEMAPDTHGRFSAKCAATENAYLYLFEVTNAENNAAQFPSVLQRTPYWVIPDQKDEARLE